MRCICRISSKIISDSVPNVKEIKRVEGEEREAGKFIRNSYRPVGYSHCGEQQGNRERKKYTEEKRIETGKGMEISKALAIVFFTL